MTDTSLILSPAK